MPGDTSWADLGARMVSEGCTDDLLASNIVGVVRKNAANPENLLAGSFQRSLLETCDVLTKSSTPLRIYADMCGAEPDVNHRVAQALVRIRALLCGDSDIASAAASEWSCWQQRATSFWNCAQQSGWTGTAQACQLLDKLSECYEHVASEGCNNESGRAARRLVLRALAPIPQSQCPELERAARALRRDTSWNWVLIIGVGLLFNVVLALLILGCCTWYRRRRLRHEKLETEPS